MAMTLSPSMSCISWIALVCLLLLQTSDVRSDGIFTARTSGPLTFPKDVHDPKYTLKLLPPMDKALQQSVNPDRTVYMTSKEGERYMCILPEDVEGEGGVEAASSSKGAGTEATETPGLHRSPEELLEALRDKCYQRIEGWWIYELCYKNHMRQYHAERGQVVAEFYLGHYDKAATKKLHSESGDVFTQKDPRSQTANLKYHAHLYTNGTECDLSNTPRSTEVRFICAEDDKGSIAAVDEPATCQYTVIFHTSLLCKHPAFRVERQPWNVIKCHLVPEANAEKAEVTTDEESQGKAKS